MPMTNEQVLAGPILSLDSLRRNGDFVTDKTGVKMVELIAPRIELDPSQPLLKFGDARKTPEKYCDAELEWYLSEDLSVEFIGKRAKIWQDIACKDGFVNSNYGYLIFSEENGNQFQNTLNELRKNPESRRAAMIYNRPSIWEDYNVNGRSDYICTFATQHMIRDGDYPDTGFGQAPELITVVNMRSNDLIFGFFNDFYWQCYVHMLLYKSLLPEYPNLQLGKIVWVANSLHVYERHFGMLEEMAEFCADDLEEWWLNEMESDD